MKLSRPDDIRSTLARRYANQNRAWLVGEGEWPLSFPLGIPTEKEVGQNPAAVREWVAMWERHSGPGTVVREARQWARLGRQDLPASIAFHDAAAVAEFVGAGQSWRSATERYVQLVEQWPQLNKHPGVGRHFTVLAEYPREDFDRLLSMLRWLERHPASGMSVRQLPVEGLDTKWLERRTGLVTDFLQLLRGTPERTGDFYEICGLCRHPTRIRLRVLCPSLRQAMGGLGDVEAPVADLAQLPIAPSTVLIVENLETGLALPDLPGVVAVMKLGNGVRLLGALPWASECPAIYWGDVDTFGFAILARARAILPQLKSLLMDESTLMAYRSLCVEEPSQCPDLELPTLTPEERAVWAGLRSNRWGVRLRLEQERVPWAFALDAIRCAATPLS